MLKKRGCKRTLFANFGAAGWASAESEGLKRGGWICAMLLVRGEAAPLRESADQPPRSSPVHSPHCAVAVARGIVRGLRLGRGHQPPAATPPAPRPHLTADAAAFFLLLLSLRERPFLGTLPAHIAAAFIHAHMRDHTAKRHRYGPFCAWSYCPCVSVCGLRTASTALIVQSTPSALPTHDPTCRRPA